LGEDFMAPEAFVAELEYAGASFEERGGCAGRVESHAFQHDSVDNRINAR
jgi:hypothetical protein